MRKFFAVIAAALTAAGTLTSCSGGSGAGEKRPSGAAVVVVSGGDAVSPFTTNDQACATGLAAGNTDTAIREFLVDKKYTVYTSPAMNGRGQVVDQQGFGAFGVCPVTLPENMTVNSTGSIDAAGEHLARFINWLHTDKGVTEVDLVAHSMGGLYSRAAIRVLASTSAPIKVRTLTTIGTPWQGSFLSDYSNDLIPMTDCGGDKLCEGAMRDFRARTLQLMSGSGREVNKAFLMGSNGWNQFQSGVLDRIPVTLIAGSKFTLPGPGNPAVWPNDGIVALESALAAGINDPVLPHRRCFSFDDTHSIFVSDQAKLDWKTALTWDPQVFDVVNTAIQAGPMAIDSPNREGC
ncbi:MAG: esterase/lipase family protein [Mycobacterium sp.]